MIVYLIPYVLIMLIMFMISSIMLEDLEGRNKRDLARAMLFLPVWPILLVAFIGHTIYRTWQAAEIGGKHE